MQYKPIVLLSQQKAAEEPRVTLKTQNYNVFRRTRRTSHSYILPKRDALSAGFTYSPWQAWSCLHPRAGKADTNGQDYFFVSAVPVVELIRPTTCETQLMSLGSCRPRLLHRWDFLPSDVSIFHFWIQSELRKRRINRDSRVLAQKEKY